MVGDLYPQDQCHSTGSHYTHTHRVPNLSCLYLCLLRSIVRFILVALMVLMIVVSAEKQGELRGMSTLDGEEMGTGIAPFLKRRLQGYCYYCRCCYSLSSEGLEGGMLNDTMVIEVQPGQKIEIVGASAPNDAPVDAALVDMSTVCIPENMMCEQQSDCCDGLTCTYSMVLGGTLCANI